MVNGAFYFFAAAADFGLQCRDTRFEFLDRKRIEVLPRELRGRIVMTTRKILVGVHAR